MPGCVRLRRTSHSLRKVEAYLTVREILPETSKGADGVAWREFSGFGRQQVCNVRVNPHSKSSRIMLLFFLPAAADRIVRKAVMVIPFFPITLPISMAWLLLELACCQLWAYRMPLMLTDQ